MTCTTPPSSGLTTIEVSINGQEFSNAVDYEYLPSPRVHNIDPDASSVSSHATVIVQGVNFVESPSLRCLFGDVVVPARWWDSTKLSCTAPIGIDIGTVDFRVSNDGVAFLHDLPLAFKFLPSPTVTSISPTSGPSIGGTMVTLTGSGFINSTLMSCRFGMALPSSPALYLSDRRIICASTAQQPGAVVVNVSVNGVDFVGHGPKFEYTLGPIVRSVSPSRIPESGSLIYVIGEQFVSPAWCKFGSFHVTRGDVLNSSTVACEAPAARRGSSLSVKISTTSNELDFVGSPGRQVTYDPLPALYSVFPSVITESSTNITLVVRGAHFIDAAGISCVFDGAMGSVPALWMNSDEVQCQFPQISLTHPHEVTVYVSNNGGHNISAQGAVITLRPPITVTSIQPSSGPASGGTRVTIVRCFHDRCLVFPSMCLTIAHAQQVGKNIPMDASTTSCVFNGTMEYVYVPITVENASFISCLSPPAPAGSHAHVRIHVSGAHMSESSKDAIFKYAQDTRIVNATPSLWNSAGGTLVSIEGLHFVGDDVRCQFGSAPSVIGHINGSRVACIAPQMDVALPDAPNALDGADGGEHPKHGVLTLKVTTNGQNYVIVPGDFSYAPLPVILGSQPASDSIKGGAIITLYVRLNYDVSVIAIHK